MIDDGFQSTINYLLSGGLLTLAASLGVVVRWVWKHRQALMHIADEIDLLFKDAHPSIREARARMKLKP